MNDVTGLALICATLVLLSFAWSIFYLSQRLVNASLAFERFASRTLDTATANSQDARDITRARFEAESNLKLPPPRTPEPVRRRAITSLEDVIPVNPETGEAAPFTM